VLSHKVQPIWLEAAPQPLKDVVILLESGLRPGEAANLRWSDLRLLPAVHAKFGLHLGQQREVKEREAEFEPDGAGG
jgi:integrase